MQLSLQFYRKPLWETKTSLIRFYQSFTSGKNQPRPQGIATRHTGGKVWRSCIVQPFQEFKNVLILMRTTPTNTGLFHQQKPFLANNWTTWTNFFQPQPQISKASKVVHTTEYNRRSDQDGSKGKNRSFVLHLHKNCDEIHGSVFNPKIIPKDSGSQGLCPWTPVAMALISWLYTSHPNRKF